MTQFQTFITKQGNRCCYQPSQAKSLHYSIAQQLQTGIDRPSHSGVVADFCQHVPSFTWLRCTQITFQSHYVTFEFIGKSNLTQDTIEAFQIVASELAVSSPSFTLRVMTRSGHRCLTGQFLQQTLGRESLLNVDLEKKVCWEMTSADLSPLNPSTQKALTCYELRQYRCATCSPFYCTSFAFRCHCGTLWEHFSLNISTAPNSRSPCNARND